MVKGRQFSKEFKTGTYKMYCLRIERGNKPSAL